VRVQTINFPELDIDNYRFFWSRHCDEVAAIDFKDALNRKSGLMHDWACPQLWQRMTIQWEGTVLPCNNDDLCLLSPGNVKVKSLYACWHDAKVKKARNLHRNGKSHKIASCDGCPWRSAQINKLKEMELKSNFRS
jgi:radical SAM protein with 4Fe4S-binding SPASM domain